MLLEQRNGSEVRIYQITDNGLSIKELNKLGEQHRFVPFESISRNLVKLNFDTVKWIILVVLIVLFIVSGLFIALFGIEGEGRFYRHLIFFLLGGATVLFIDNGKRVVLSCYNQDGIEFSKDEPNKREFDDFIEELLNRRDKILRKKYCFVSEFIPYEEQLSKFSLLHEFGIINLEEFESLKVQLDLLASRNDNLSDFNLN